MGSKQKLGLPDTANIQTSAQKLGNLIVHLSVVVLSPVVEVGEEVGLPQEGLVQAEHGRRRGGHGR